MTAILPTPAVTGTPSPAAFAHLADTMRRWRKRKLEQDIARERLAVAFGKADPEPVKTLEMAGAQ